MPIYRYRLTVLLQTVIDSDQGLFAKQAREYLESDKIHFYFKAVVFEVISQLTTPDHAIFALVGDYYSRDEWHNFILQTVFNRHPVFIDHIKPQHSLYWFSEEGYPLLATMKMYSPEYVISVLQELIESNAIEVERIFKFLGTGIEEENEVFFAFRVSLYKNNLNFLSDIHYIDLDQIKPNHVLPVL